MLDDSLRHVEYDGRAAFAESVAAMADCIDPLELNTPQTLNRHFAQGNPRKLPASHRLWSQGDERIQVCLIRTGSLCFSRMLPDGRRVVIGFGYPGDIVGLGADVHSFNAEAIQPTKLCTLSIGAFQRAMVTDPAFAKMAQAEVGHALASAYDHVVVVSKLTAAERLAHFLVELSNRNTRRGNSPYSVVLPMRRIDIADYLGLTIETVSRTFTCFRQSGLIAMDQPSVIFLRELRRLAVLASGNGDVKKSDGDIRQAA